MDSSLLNGSVGRTAWSPVRADTLAFPGRWCIVKLKSANYPIQCKSVAFSFAEDKTGEWVIISEYFKTWCVIEIVSKRITDSLFEG